MHLKVNNLLFSDMSHSSYFAFLTIRHCLWKITEWPLQNSQSSIDMGCKKYKIDRLILQSFLCCLYITNKESVNERISAKKRQKRVEKFEALGSGSLEWTVCALACSLACSFDWWPRKKHLFTSNLITPYF